MESTTPAYRRIQVSHGRTTAVRRATKTMSSTRPGRNRRRSADVSRMSRAKPPGLLVTEPMRIEPKRVGYHGDRALVDRIENEDRLVGSGVGEFVQVVVQFA